MTLKSTRPITLFVLKIFIHETLEDPIYVVSVIVNANCVEFFKVKLFEKIYLCFKKEQLFSVQFIFILKKYLY